MQDLDSIYFGFLFVPAMRNGSFAHGATIPLSGKFRDENSLSGRKPEERSTSFATKCLQFQLKCANKNEQKDKLNTLLVKSHNFLFSCF